MNKINLSEYRAFLKQKHKFEQIVKEHFALEIEWFSEIDHIDLTEGFAIVYYHERYGEDLHSYYVDLLKLTGKT